ncbi:MAG TPA: hypothetical protein VGS98_04055 [Thermoanaerobaculia bacterium]|jgi:hypothetical protein|nr:hypothetical protein [Thermoanaerobaculia bacterium]
MSASIRYRETTELSSSGADARNGLALRFDATRRLTLRFRLELDSDDDVEALRYARRIMIREERTRGLEWDEPSIEDAVFTVTDVSWSVLASQAAWCREKVRVLVERANRLLSEITPRDSGDTPAAG